ncbi:MAG: glycine oxidase ThiO [Pyrinomonadaceae bacterium]
MIADVIVLGGGVAGLAVARELALRGVRVTLVERATLGKEASWAAAGMLAPQVEADERDEFFDFACESRDAYPAFADALREETGVDIELDCTGTLYLAFTEEDDCECLRRFECQRGAGLIVERLTAEEVRALEPNLSPRVRSALRFPRAWAVENRKLCDALARACRRAGAEILEGTEARSVSADGARFASVETSRGTLGADACVVACGAWSSRLPIKVSDGAQESPAVEPVRGQILCYAMGAGAPLVSHVVYSPRGYVVPRRDGRLLAGTTVERAGFDKSVTDEGRRAITAHPVEIAPAVEGLRQTDEWAGLRPRADDALPLLGMSTEIENLFYATGHYRNGILLAPLTGALVADLITTGETPAPLAPFSPARLARANSRAV